MSDIQITDAAGNVVQTTSSGFLADAQDWDKSVADSIAAWVKIELTEAHWEIILFIREYYLKYKHIPNTRMFMKAIRTQLGEHKGTTRYLYRLFPEAPLKFVCLIGGLPKPTSCI